MRVNTIADSQNTYSNTSIDLDRHPHQTPETYYLPNIQLT